MHPLMENQSEFWCEHQFEIILSVFMSFWEKFRNDIVAGGGGPEGGVTMSMTLIRTQIKILHILFLSISFSTSKPI